MQRQMTILQVSSNTIFALCLSQAAVMIGVITCYPPVHVEVYTPHPVIINGTIHSPDGPKTTTRITVTSLALAIQFSLISCVGALFSTTTTGLIQRNILQHDAQYSHEVLYETGLWDLMFWTFCSGTHALLLLIVMSPSDIYAVALSALLIIYFLCRLCQPRISQLNMTQENLNLLGYWAGLLIAGYNLPDAHTGRLAALFIMCLLDYMLGVGHTWDVTPTMDTITNCRLFWVCSASFCMAGLYGAWHDHLLLERNGG
jgi:hypothetical protein